MRTTAAALHLSASGAAYVNIYYLLLQSKTHVSAVLNKTRNYVPARLLHDINAG